MLLALDRMSKYSRGRNHDVWYGRVWTTRMTSYNVHVLQEKWVMSSSYRIKQYSADQLAAIDPCLLDGWRRCLERGGSGGVYMHPDIVRSRSSAGKVDQVFMLTDEKDCVKGLGILAPKAIPTRPLGRLGPKLMLNGYRLVGDQLIVPDNPELLDSFVSRLCDRLIGGDAQILLIEELSVESPLRQSIQRVTQDRRGVTATTT